VLAFGGMILAGCLALTAVLAVIGQYRISKALKEAIAARQDAEKSRKTAEIAEKKVKLDLYWKRINDANRDCSEHNFVGAEALLDHCKADTPTLCLWEWHYLKRLCHPVLTLKEAKGFVRGVIFSPDGTRLVGASDDGTVKLWDAATGKECFSLKGQTHSLVSLALSLNGKFLASAAEGGAAKVWDLVTREACFTTEGRAGSVGSVAFSPDSKRLATGGSGRWDAENKSVESGLKVWDLATDRESFSLKGHTAAVFSVVFSPDGKRLLSAAVDGTVKVWDAILGKECFSFSIIRQKKRVISGAFSPDSNRLASAAADGTVTVWDTATGKEHISLECKKKELSVVFSPDSKRLASAAVDGTVTVWDATTGAEVVTIREHMLPVLGLDFSPDGKHLASASFDGTVKVWYADKAQNALPLKEQGFQGAR
jgi:WD40 repeat protein